MRRWLLRCIAFAVGASLMYLFGFAMVIVAAAVTGTNLLCEHFDDCPRPVIDFLDRYQPLPILLHWGSSISAGVALAARAWNR